VRTYQENLRDFQELIALTMAIDMTDKVDINPETVNKLLEWREAIREKYKGEEMNFCLISNCTEKPAANSDYCKIHVKTVYHCPNEHCFSYRIADRGFCEKHIPLEPVLAPVTPSRDLKASRISISKTGISFGRGAWLSHEGVLNDRGSIFNNAYLVWLDSLQLITGEKLTVDLTTVKKTPAPLPMEKLKCSQGDYIILTSEDWRVFDKDRWRPMTTQEQIDASNKAGG